MNRNCLPNVLIAALVFATLLCPPRARATADASSSILFNNLQIIPASGTLQFTADWGVQAYAQAGGNTAFAQDIATTVLTNASDAFAYGFGEAVATHPPTNNVMGLAYSTVSIPNPIAAEDSATGNGSLDGMFTITGGTGTVSTVFSVLRVANLSVFTDEYGVKAQTAATFLLEIDGSPIISDWHRLSIGPDETESLTLSDALSNSIRLNFDTSYWLHLEVDSESYCSNIPEPSARALLAAGLVGLACLRGVRRTLTTRAFPKGRQLRAGFLLLAALTFLPHVGQAKYLAGAPPGCDCPSCQTCCGKPLGPDKPPCQCAGGSRISLVEGNLSDDYSLVTVRSASGPTLDLTLTYNSYDADDSRSLVNTVMGLGWTHTYNVYLFNQRGSMFLMDGIGQLVKFQASWPGIYHPTLGFLEKLVQNPDGTFTMTNTDLTVFNFASISNTHFMVQGNVYRLTSIVDRNQNTTSLSYSNGNLVAVTDAYGRSMMLGYNNQNRLQTVTDPLGRTTTLQYDSNGTQLVTVTDPAGQSVHYAYNFMNQLAFRTNKNSLVYSYLYTNLMPVSIVDPAGQRLFTLSNSVNWGVDEKNLAFDMTRQYIPGTTTKTDGRSNTWLYAYDIWGHITQVTAPDLTTTFYHYDSATLRVGTKIDANGGVTVYSYDANANVTNMTDALGNVTSYTYDPVLNKLTSMTDPNGYVTSWQYDSHGNRTREIDAMGFTRSWTYDTHGNVLAATDKNGNVTRYYYDQFGNRTNTTDALGNITSFTYDAVGNLLARTDANLHVTTNAYDVLDRLVSVTTGLSDPPPLLSPPALIPVTLNVSTLPDGSIFLEWDGAGMVLTKASNLAGPFEDVLTGGALVTTSPLQICAPLTNACEFYRLRPVGGSLPQSGGPQLGPSGGGPPPTPSVTTYSYDPQGNKISETDANAHTTRYAYDVRNRLTYTTNALGYITALSYDGENNKISETDANGHTTWYAYDSQNRLAYITNALGCVTAFAYDPVGNKIAATDANGNTTISTYDGLNRLTTTTNALGYVTQYEYDAAIGGGACGCGAGTKGTSHITKQTDANGKVTYFKYDPLGRLLKTISKQGGTADLIGTNDAVTAYTYDPNGNSLTMTDPNSITNFLGYDALNRIVAMTNGAGDVVLATYDPVGNITTNIAPNGNVTTYTYDAQDRLIQADDSIGPVARYTYDGLGNFLSATDGNTNITLYGYDPLNRLVTTTDPMGSSSTDIYDPVANLIQSIDRNGHSTTYACDPLNRRTNTVDAMGYVTTSTYDGVGNLLAITDANNHNTSYEYDALNRKVRETYADSAADTRTFTYDGVGNLTSRTDQKGNTTLYLYSDLYYLTNRVYANDPADRFTYDLAGRMLAASKTNSLATNDWVVTFAYDGANRVIQSVQNGQTISYSYNIPGRTRTVTYPGGRVITEHTDFRARLAEIDDPGSLTPIVLYTYDLANRVLNRAYRNGTVAACAYNANNWITNLNHTAGATLIAGFDYAYDNEGNKNLELKRHQPAASEAYVYDSTYRLTNYLVGALVGSTIPSPSIAKTWNLDPVGNWNNVVTNGVLETRTHDAVNELVAINGQPIAYDDNGNLQHDAAYTYAYDEENRLTQVTRNSDAALVGQYQYDALSRRVQKIANPAGIPITTRYFHDDARIIEEQDALGATQATYTYGNYIDEVLTINRATQTYYYYQNALCSVEAITDSTANPVERYAYDAYGFVTVTDGSGNHVPPNSRGSPHSAIGNPYLFTGRQLDEETGLYFYRARHYGAVKGRFLQRDPLGYVHGMNLYEYVLSRPTGRSDPFGEADQSGGTASDGEKKPCCCCCATDLKITGLGPEGAFQTGKVGKNSFGSAFNASFNLENKKSDKKKGCRMQYWEQSTYLSDEQKATGWKENEWKDQSTVGDSKQKAQWDKATETIEKSCPSEKQQFKVSDVPSGPLFNVVQETNGKWVLGTPKSWERTLYFAITIESGCPDCPSLTVFAIQKLKVENGAGTGNFEPVNALSIPLPNGLKK